VVPDPEQEKEQTVLWTKKHYKEEFNLMVATREEPTSSSSTNEAGRKIAPVNLLSASIPVQFQITNLADYAYNHEDGPKLLEDIANREVVRFLVSADLFEIMSSGRLKAAEELRNRIQKEANDLELGANILFVGLQDIHPPVKVAPSFETNNAVIQEKEAKILKAEADAVRTNALAQGESARRVHQAEAYQVRRVTGAAAQAAQFTNQLAAYQASPAVFSERAYLQALARGGANARKYILTTTNVSQIIQLNLEQKLRPDLMDTYVPPGRK
jgi:regulator of protease activity HflC (stomatin/prohibitin superfamily)